MENPTQFDLTLALRRWREQLLASPAVRSADVEELQDHLLENIRHLQGVGLSESEAFWVSTHRLGQPNTLIQQYESRNQSAVWLDRVLWMVIGSLGIGILGQLVHTFAAATTLGAVMLGDKAEIIGPLNACCQLVGWGITLLLIHRLSQRQDSSLTRFAHWTVSRPVRAGLWALGILVLIRVGSGGLTALLAASMTPSTYGHLALWQVSCSSLHLVLWPAILFWLLRKRQMNRREPSVA